MTLPVLIAAQKIPSISPCLYKSCITNSRLQTEVHCHRFHQQIEVKGTWRYWRESVSILRRSRRFQPKKWHQRREETVTVPWFSIRLRAGVDQVKLMSWICEDRNIWRKWKNFPNERQQEADAKPCHVTVTSRWTEKVTVSPWRIRAWLKTQRSWRRNRGRP